MRLNVNRVLHTPDLRQDFHFEMDLSGLEFGGMRPIVSPVVVDGQVRIVSGDREIIASKDEAVFVDGMTPHSIWNNGAKTAVVIKISTAREDGDIGANA